MSDLLYLRLDGVDGEEPIGDSQKLISIVSYQHNLDQPVTPNRPSQGKDSVHRRSFCRHAPFRVVKGFDKTSAKLFAAASAGVTFKKAIVHACTSQFQSLTNTSKPGPFLSIIMDNAIISGFSYGCEGDWPMETLSFQYASIGWKVNWPDPEDGEEKKLEPVGWDGQKNQPGAVEIPKNLNWNANNKLI